MYRYQMSVPLIEVMSKSYDESIYLFSFVFTIFISRIVPPLSTKQRKVFSYLNIFKDQYSLSSAQVVFGNCVAKFEKFFLSVSLSARNRVFSFMELFLFVNLLLEKCRSVLRFSGWPESSLCSDCHTHDCHFNRILYISFIKYSVTSDSLILLEIFIERRHLLF